MVMLKAIEGVFRDGAIELAEVPGDIREAKVIVTFLPATNGGPVDLAERGIDQQQAVALRSKLRSFAEDWERPEMDVYDAI
jgi:hypothetical protein